MNSLITNRKADIEMIWIVIALVFVVLGIVMALVLSGKIGNLGEGIVLSLGG